MDWHALAEAVKARRVDLGMVRQQDLVAATGLTRRLLSDIEHGRRDNYDPITLARLERALQWMTGSVQAVLEGGEPRPLPSAPAVDPRSLERDGDEMQLLTLLATAGLPPADTMRIVGHIRLRRQQQHADLVAEVEKLIVEAGGTLPDEQGRAG